MNRRSTSQPVDGEGFRAPKDAVLDSRHSSQHLLIACLGVSLLLAGCGLLSRTKSLFGGTLPIDVSVDSNANQNSPIAVAFVVVYNKKLLEKLQEMTARQWFERHVQIARDSAKAFKAEIHEWVPGQEVGRIEMRVKRGARAGIVFADYFSEGSHRHGFDPHKRLAISLRKDGFQLEQD